MIKQKKKQGSRSLEEILVTALIPKEEQPYGVPSNWVWVNLKFLLSSLESGKRPKGGVNDINEGVPSLGGEHLNYNGNFSFENIKFVPVDFAESMNKGIIKTNDILIVKDGATTGKTSFVSSDFPFERAVVNEHVFICRSSDKIYSKYLFYYISSIYGQKSIKENLKGSAQGGINSSFVENFPIPLSALKEQKRICEKIESIFSKIDQAKELLEEVTDEIKLRKISIIKTILENGKEDAIKNGWRFKPIKDVFRIAGGGTPSKAKSNYWGGDIPWISAKDMKTLYIENTKDYITEEGLNNSSAKKYNKGSIAMVVRSGILQHSLPVAYLMKNCSVNQDLKVFDSGDDFINKYFLWYVKANEKFLLKEYSKSGTTVNSIEFEKFKSHIIPIPPKQLIEEKISKIESVMEKENNIAKYTHLVFELDNLKRSILNKAFCGELGTNNPSEESAIAILKEIINS